MLTQKFLDLFSIGAEWVMYLLLATSLYGTAVILDRVRLFLGTRERFEALRADVQARLSEGKTSEALRAVSGDSLVRNVLRSGLSLVAGGERRTEPVEQAMLGALAAERTRYERRLSSLVTIGNVAPLMGLLGTVIGIVEAFAELGRMGTAAASTNQVVMSAIGEALVATAIGIGVAVPAVVFYNAVRAHLGVRVRQAEALQRELISWLPRLPAGRVEG
jgi:biopolymer transport protein ExbB